MYRVWKQLGATRACLALATVLFATVLRPSRLAAEPVDDATRAAARAIGEEGLDAYDAGRFEEAVEKLESAHAAVPVPTLGLWLARALAKSGKLVEASERYGEVTRLQVEAGQDKDKQREAQADAHKERAALLPLIPDLRIQPRWSRGQRRSREQRRLGGQWRFGGDQQRPGGRRRPGGKQRPFRQRGNHGRGHGGDR
ncbi:MAG: hypothetical protein JW751_21535 [Polyangiaceae bacterium]|nr:hypothetical protein [Polyangiaceae bacterium]